MNRRPYICCLQQISPKPRIGSWRLQCSSYSQDTSRKSQDAPITAHLGPRWLSDLKKRIGRCINFGIDAEKMREAGVILACLAKDWRELVAGSEGFLTSPDRRGLYRQGVVWGEQVNTSEGLCAKHWLTWTVGCNGMSEGSCESLSALLIFMKGTQAMPTSSKHGF